MLFYKHENLAKFMLINSELANNNELTTERKWTVRHRKFKTMWFLAYARFTSETIMLEWYLLFSQGRPSAHF